MLLKDLTKSRERVNIYNFPINMVSGEYDFSKLKINFALYQIAK